MSVHPPLIAELIGFGCKSLPRGERSWARHVHGYHQFDATLGGEVEVTCDGLPPFRSRRGQCLLIPPLVWHGVRTRRGWEVGLFYFRVSPYYWHLFGNRPCQALLPAHSAARIRAAHKDCASGGPLATHQAEALLTLCLIEMPRQAGRPAVQAAARQARQAPLWPLLEKIESNPRAAWSVTRMAGEFQMTRDHFAKQFSQILGQTPHRYLLRTRMQAAARELVGEPERPIKAVARAFGYSTEHAFSRAFLHVMGVRPGEFRRGAHEFQAPHPHPARAKTPIRGAN